jgi:predicted nucleic acid-binding protein
MKLMIDLNIFIDVFQKRLPHYHDSSLVLTKILNKESTGFIAGHSITTLYYLISRLSSNRKAIEVVDWVLDHFEVESADKEDFIDARALNMKDFEDAVIARCARNAKCEYIITRNNQDFKRSPVPAVTPKEFLRLF